MNEREPETRTAHLPPQSPETEAEETERPAPGIEHHTEPDAENIMPAKDMPGTL